LSPLLAVIPLLFALVTPGRKVMSTRVLFGSISLLAAVVALPFLIGDLGWITDTTRRLTVNPDVQWALILGAACLPLLILDGAWRRVGLTGVVLALVATVGLLLPVGGPGVEEALLVLVSIGTALVVAAGLDRFEANPR